ncbi:hypothetical protein [Pelagicoccus sp. SDUM812003]|uniref:hypothetical protein n=1 Tax=Pelagicoccus sp. SDUM812003 TaxID=3041267 RepID=UPI00280F750E|nr:hypothetical protein [Pelagicoccus sp. SDUM812003]MDQ8202701.1 hypothetical protein [Pelagicoccus sp. SDUM812003]
MSYSTNLANSLLPRVDHIFDRRYVLQFATFVVSSDIAASSYAKSSLLSLTLETLDSSVPVGALIIFVLLYALLLLFCRKLYFWAFIITNWPVTWILHKTGLSKIRREVLDDLKRHSIPNYKLSHYLSQNDNKILHEKLIENERKIREEYQVCVLKFLVSSLVSITLFLEHSTICSLWSTTWITPQYVVLLITIPYLFFQLHKSDNYEHFVYVGEETVDYINEKES